MRFDCRKDRIVAARRKPAERGCDSRHRNSGHSWNARQQMPAAHCIGTHRISPLWNVMASLLRLFRRTRAQQVGHQSKEVPRFHEMSGTAQWASR
jgi:hypothetical protein